MTTAPHTTLTAATKAVDSRLRRDIEGLRALAVLLVLAFHAGIDLIPGGFAGVDIFFVISGFLITGHLVREVETHGRVDLPRFFARRARRLLPAAATVLLFTLAIVAFLAPSTFRTTFAGDVALASVYVANWGFANRSIDYLAQEIGESPVQHFWSLGVEEQFYLIWPLLIVIGVILARRFAWKPRPTMGILLTLVVAPSFAWSVWETANDPAFAYFDTRTRLWQLGIGALAAIAAPYLARLPHLVAQLLAVAGAAAIAWTALTVEASVAWPGTAALLPTLGATAIIVAGLGRTTAVGSVLSIGPAVWIGGLSYSLYLWHWPLLIGAEYLWGSLSTREGTVVVLASILPAWLSARFIERPIRFHPRLVASNKASLTLGAVLSIGTLLIAVGYATVSRPPEVERLPVSAAPPVDLTQESLDAGMPVGALAFGDSPELLGASEPQARFPAITPLPEAAMQDSSTPDGCQIGKAKMDPEGCELGDPDGDVEVWLVGDSKMSQWYEAFDAVGRENGWAMTMHTKSSCPFSDAYTQDDGGPYETCETWNATILDMMEAAQPDLVFTSQMARLSYLPGEPFDLTHEATVEGLVSRWSELEAQGIPVVALLDNPSPSDRNTDQCVADNFRHVDECAFDRAQGEVKSATPAMVEAATQVEGVRQLSLNDYICFDEVCPAVIGNVLLYRNYNHLTSTYVGTLAPALAREIAALDLSL